MVEKIDHAFVTTWEHASYSNYYRNKHFPANFARGDFPAILIVFTPEMYLINNNEPKRGINMETYLSLKWNMFVFEIPKYLFILPLFTLLGDIPLTIVLI